MDLAELHCRRVVARAPAAAMTPLGARLRVAHLLGTADLRPPGLPPTAVLLIRRLATGPALPLGALRASPAWERTARAKVAACLGHAVRPLQGRVPAGTEAVLFRDEAEWFAAAALAATEGALPWWWTAPLAPAATGGIRGGAGSEAVALAWAASPRSVPGAVARLTAWGALGAALAPWPTRMAERVLMALVAAFSLSAALAEVGPMAQAAAPAAKPSGLPEPGAAAPPIGTALTGFGPGPPPRWSDAEVPDQVLAAVLTDANWPALTPATRRLALVAQGLAIVPRWLHAPEAPMGLARLASARTAGRVAALPSPRCAAALPTNADDRSEAENGLPAKPRRAPLRTANRTRIPLGEASSSAPPLTFPPPEARPPDANPTPATAHRDRPPDRAAAATIWPDEGEPTALGGLFLLLDVVLRADLPDILRAELDLPRLITGWAILELLGRALLAPEDASCAADPAWAALALLDGRAPGETLPLLPWGASLDFRAPMAWLPTDAGPWLASRRGRRLLLRHPAGDLLLDRRCPEESIVAALAAERHRLGDRVPLRPSPPPSPPDPLAGWVGCASFVALPRCWRIWSLRLLPCLLAQTGRRLRVTPDEAVPLLRTLIRRPARLHLAPAHLDLVFRLEDVSLEARLAGLDADPGWVRDLMRAVRFHFVC